MKNFVRKLINGALDNAKNVGDLELSFMPEIVVEKPKEEKFGDFSTSLAMSLAKSERRKPYEIAEILSRHLQRSDDNIASVTIAGPGFLNITMRRSFFLERLLNVAEQSDRYEPPLVPEIRLDQQWKCRSEMEFWFKLIMHQTR